MIWEQSPKNTSSPGFRCPISQSFSMPGMHKVTKMPHWATQIQRAVSYNLSCTFAVSYSWLPTDSCICTHKALEIIKFLLSCVKSLPFSYQERLPKQNQRIWDLMMSELDRSPTHHLLTLGRGRPIGTLEVGAASAAQLGH